LDWVVVDGVHGVLMKPVPEEVALDELALLEEVEDDPAALEELDDRDAKDELDDSAA